MVTKVNASQIGYMPAGNGAVATTVQDNLRQRVSVKNFKCVDGLPVQGDGIHDDTTGIQAAIDSISTGEIDFPIGKYRLTNTITVKAGVTLKGGSFVPEIGYRHALPAFIVETPIGTTPAFLVRTSSAIIGFSFEWPGQAPISASTPVEFGWAIATDIAWSSAGNVDDVWLENLFLANPYKGINLDKAGRNTLKHIYGQPISTGILIDKVYDIPRWDHVHFWTFYAPPGNPLYNWIYNNGVAFDIRRADGLVINDIFCYGYQYGMKFSNGGDGAPWVAGVNIHIDICHRPIYFDKVSRISLTNVICSSGNNVSVGIDTGEAIEGSVQLSNVQVFGVGIGVVNRSTTGSFSVDNLYATVENGTGNCQVSSIILSGQGVSRVSNITGNKNIYGNDSVLYDGIQLPHLDLDVTPDNFSTPAIWGVNSRCATIPNGASFALDGGITAQSFSLPSHITQMKGIFIIEFDIEYKGTLNASAWQFYLRLRDGGYLTYFQFPDSINQPVFLTKTKIRMPLITALGEVFEFVWGTTVGSNLGNTVEITNLKLWQQNSTKSTNTFVEFIGISQNAINVHPTYPGASLSFQGGKKQLLLTLSAPTFGTWRAGDKAINYTPVVGQPKSWVCTAAGTPGTWVSEGNL